MTETEQKALELEQQLQSMRWQHELTKQCLKRAEAERDRAIEAHQSDKARHAAELREQAERFSEVAGRLHRELDGLLHKDSVGGAALAELRPFVLPAADPLVEAARDAGWAEAVIQSSIPSLRKALADRGLSIVAKED